MLGISVRGAPRVRTVAAVSGLLTATLALAACSSTSPSTTPSSSTGSNGAANAAAMAAAKAEVLKVSAFPTYQGPSTPLDTSKLKGKTVYIINSFPTNAFQAQLVANFTEAATLMGMKTVHLADPNPAQESNYVNQAVNGGAAGIALLSIGPGQVSTALQNAANAHIPVVTMAQSGAGDPVGTNISNSIDPSVNEIGKAQVDYAYVLSNGVIDGIGYGGATLPQDVSQWKGQSDEIQALCPTTCKWKSQDIDLSTFQTQMPTIANAAMVADPNLNWFFPTWDILGSYLVPAIQQQNKAGIVRWTAWNGIPAAMDLVSQGKQQATFGSPLKWWGYGTADMLGRYIAGEQVAPYAENLPFRLFDKAALDAAGSTSDESKLYNDDAAIQQYKTLWGIK